MDRIKEIITSIGVIIVLLLAIAACYGIVCKLIDLFAAVDPDYGVALIAAAVTIILSVLSIILSRYFEAQAIVRKEHREKKIPVYEDLLAFMSKMSMGTKTGNSPTEKEMIEFMYKFTQQSMVWAADEVLNAWIKFHRTSLDEDAKAKDPSQLMFQYEDLIRAIRKDLGHKNKGLNKGNLLSLFINDIGNYVDADGNVITQHKA